ncbi:hypothetical protein [Litoreibacter arenae]|uniref:Uncharacterized protein n=1 Tax=Litoreibacter arenae DSM 19593 TaxID=1123360 RepID=S9QJF0_9RHOB|nr:hypothetical protein [Litoreibacter arenae]EPX79937.1 hypothetical protein thalar_01273 [Litoreibacter arenae DSM 19593]
MSNVATYPFDPSILDELVDMIGDMGAEFAIGTLDAVLSESNGAIVSEGVTRDMYEGQVITAVVAADAVAVSHGEAPSVLNDALMQAVKPFAEDLRDTDGTPDLAAKALRVITDGTSSIYGTMTGELPTRAEFLEITSKVQDSVSAAKQRNPGEWAEITGDGVFEITMHPDNGEADD